MDAQGPVFGDLQIAREIHHRFRVNEITLLIVKSRGRDGSEE